MFGLPDDPDSPRTPPELPPGLPPRFPMPIGLPLGTPPSPPGLPMAPNAEFSPGELHSAGELAGGGDGGGHWGGGGATPGVLGAGGGVGGGAGGPGGLRRWARPIRRGSAPGLLPDFSRRTPTFLPDGSPGVSDSTGLFRRLAVALGPPGLTGTNARPRAYFMHPDIDLPPVFARCLGATAIACPRTDSIQKRKEKKNKK
ncbi:hypothetical protein T492DRAFT_837309 [Pavlovales sp. CCMP2436]|nr:hypothetical protein T492DRAFT_837309 [Pavlovales sp. CCMP2436]